MERTETYYTECANCCFSITENDVQDENGCVFGRLAKYIARGKAEKKEEESTYTISTICMETHKTFSQRVIVRIALISSFAIFIIGFGVAHAATLSFNPSSGGYSPGQTFTVTVSISSPDQAMNAVSGIISFPAFAICVPKKETISSTTGVIFSSIIVSAFTSIISKLFTFSSLPIPLELDSS